MEGINKVAISNSSINPMAISNREAINSNSNMDREVMVTILDTVVFPKHSRISKVNFNRVHLKRHMELHLRSLHRSLHKFPSGKLQQHPMGNNITTMKGLEKQLGRNLQGCHNGLKNARSVRTPSLFV